MTFYQNIETQRYEKFWRSLKGKPNKNKTHYSSGQRDTTIIAFTRIIKKEIKTGKVLDVGCGTGRNAIEFARNGFDSYGIDVSKSAIALAKKFAQKQKAKVSYKVASGFKIPFKNKTFQVIIDWGCMHHLRTSEWFRYRKEILRVLDNNGYYLLSCFATDSGSIEGFTPTTKYRKWTTRKGHFNRFFTKADVKKYFGKKFRILIFKTVQKQQSVLRFHTVMAQRLS